MRLGGDNDSYRTWAARLRSHPPLRFLSSSGQAEHDRVGLLHTLATLEEHPESVPINALVAIEGTPLADEGKADAPDIWDMGRMIATARVVMPKTMVRLSAGRLSFSEAEQASGMDADTPAPGTCRSYTVSNLMRGFLLPRVTVGVLS